MATAAPTAAPVCHNILLHRLPVRIEQICIDRQSGGRDVLSEAFLSSLLNSAVLPWCCCSCWGQSIRGWMQHKPGQPQLGQLLHHFCLAFPGFL